MNITKGRSALMVEFHCFHMGELNLKLKEFVNRGRWSGTKMPKDCKYFGENLQKPW